MSPDKSDQEANSHEFRWPKKGDQLFDQSDGRNENAEIKHRVRSRLFSMVSGYKSAADLMVEQATRDRFSRDTLVYPIVFNYRHFIELSLKELIALYGSTVGIEANWRSHDLELLWQRFIEVLDGYGCADPDETDPTVAKLVAEFAKIDPGSFSFRYPVDRNGRKIPLGIEELDLLVLADVMKGLENYFVGSGDYLDHLKYAGP